MRSTQTGTALIEKIRTAQAADPTFQKAHRMVQGIMGAWALIVILDRTIGLLMHAYGPQQLPFAILGGAALVVAAFLGTRGHLQGAMMVMQVNMAVVLIQFAATCFLYRENTASWSVLFYGVASAVLVGGSLLFFLNRDIEYYRGQLARFQGKGSKEPRFYRTNSRLVRNHK